MIINISRFFLYSKAIYDRRGPLVTRTPGLVSLFFSSESARNEMHSTKRTENKKDKKL